MRIRIMLAATVLATMATVAMAGTALAQDRDCPDFPSRQAAQDALDATPGRDPERLDADNDMLACEDHTGPWSTANPTPTNERRPPGDRPVEHGWDRDDIDSGRAPRGAIEAGAGGTAGQSDDAVALLVAGISGLAVGGALVAGRRRVRARR